jgi:His/Glu/Gln/Arg/opine family amino acid ABC transporter permease subunit
MPGGVGVEAGPALTWDILRDSMPELLEAALSTLRMTALTFLLAAALALPLALARMTPGLLGRLALLYIEIVRGMPALTLLFLIYFGLVPLGIALPAFTAAVIGLGLNGAAYVAEVYRAGIGAVDGGQREAAQMIGLRRGQVLRHVVLPQAFQVVLPPMGNYLVALLKDTSIASLISAPELMLRARDLSSEYFLPMQYYLLAGLMYLVMAWPIMRGVRLLERHLSRSRLQGSSR